MSDRDLTSRGVEVEFFGEATRLPAGPAKLASRPGRRCIRPTVYYDGDDCVVHIFDALDTGSGDVGIITQALADVFAGAIAEHPRTGTCCSPSGWPI
jgi:KDO2-lipid IV(A) lauroyltransferase